MKTPVAQATAATNDPLRRLSPRFIDPDWLVMRGMAKAIRDFAARLAGPGVVVIDFSAVFDVEYSALKEMIAAEKRMRNGGVSMWLAGLSPDVFAMVRRSPLGDALGDQRMFFNVEVAVARYLADRTQHSRTEP